MSFPTGAIAYWKLEDVSDVNGVYTLTNTGTTTFSAGKINNAANFGDSNSTKSLKNESIQATAYPITVSMWIKPKVVNGNDYFFSLADNTVHYYGMKLRDTDDHIVFRSNNNAEAGDVDTGIVAEVDTWYHVVCNIINTTHVTLYVNGTATNSNATIFVASGLDRFMLGALGRSTPIEHYSGLIDEVGYWGRSLTQDEVTALYNSGNGVSDYLTLSAVSYYKLDESSGDASDSVGSYTLTNNNTVAYTTAKINNGADFGTGADKCLTNTNDQGFSGGNWSIAGWIKMNVEIGSGNQCFFGITDTGNKISFYAEYEYNSGTRRISFYREKGGVGIQGYNYNVTLGTANWYHIVITYDGTNVVGYVNGSAVGSGAASGNGSGSITVEGFTISGRPYTSADLNKGNFIADEVGNWSRALTAGEITTLYNSGTGNQYPFSQDYTLTAESGTYNITGKATILGVTLNAGLGSFIVTGLNTILTRTAPITNMIKNLTSPVNHLTKNSTSITNKVKSPMI
jgi:hypothetical protein